MTAGTHPNRNTSAVSGQTASIVVVEDEPDIADLLVLYFQREGWSVHTAGDGETALDVIRARQPDLVFLDIGLPGGVDGLEVCRRVRSGSDVPIVFLTARDDEIDRVLGFELGADDYVAKPFSPREVVARAKAILKRGRQAETLRAPLTFGNVTVDLDRREVLLGDEPVTLAAQEFALLELLIDNQGRALSREQILNGAWGPDWYGDIRTVDVHIRQLRRKLGDDLPLATVRGVGYRLG